MISTSTYLQYLTLGTMATHLSGTLEAGRSTNPRWPWLVEDGWIGSDTFAQTPLLCWANSPIKAPASQAQARARTMIHSDLSITVLDTKRSNIQDGGIVLRFAREKKLFIFQPISRSLRETLHIRTDIFTLHLTPCVLLPRALRSLFLLIGYVYGVTRILRLGWATSRVLWRVKMASGILAAEICARQTSVKVPNSSDSLDTLSLPAYIL